MKYTVEQSLTEFNFWSGARQVVDRLTDNELKDLDGYIEELFYDEIPTDTQINDFFWFEPEMILEYLGIEEDEFWEREIKWPWIKN